MLVGVYISMYKLTGFECDTEWIWVKGKFGSQEFECRDAKYFPSIVL